MGGGSGRTGVDTKLVGDGYGSHRGWYGSPPTSGNWTGCPVTGWVGTGHPVGVEGRSGVSVDGGGVFRDTGGGRVSEVTGGIRWDLLR